MLDMQEASAGTLRWEYIPWMISMIDNVKIDRQTNQDSIIVFKKAVIMCLHGVIAISPSLIRHNMTLLRSGNVSLHL